MALETFIMNEINRLESMGQFDVSTDTIRVWIDIFIDSNIPKNDNRRSEQSACEDWKCEPDLCE